MKCLLDTNVLIDIFSNRKTNYGNPEEIIKCILFKNVKGYIVDKQVTDIYYCLKKYIKDEENLRECISLLLDSFTVLPLLKSTCVYCLKSEIKDYEDSLLAETAKINCIDYIITNNIKDFAKSESPVISPKVFITIMNVNSF